MRYFVGVNPAVFGGGKLRVDQDAFTIGNPKSFEVELANGVEEEGRAQKNLFSSRLEPMEGFSQDSLVVGREYARSSFRSSWTISNRRGGSGSPRSRRTLVIFRSMSRRVRSSKKGFNNRLSSCVCRLHEHFHELLVGLPFLGSQLAGRLGSSGKLDGRHLQGSGPRRCQA